MQTHLFNIVSLSVHSYIVSESSSKLHKHGFIFFSLKEPQEISCAQCGFLFII